MKIGFIVNPIAGMGGSVGLKGTDNLYEKAIELGAREVSQERAREFLENSKEVLKNFEILTVSGKMGENVLKECGIENFIIVYKTKEKTDRYDTIESARIMLKNNVDILIFVGGDGTARDIVEAVDSKIPVLGIPSGVKMYSAVFTPTPFSAVQILKEFLKNNVSFQEREVMDIDEEKYRMNRLEIKLYGYLKVPYLDDFVQNSKAEIYSTEDEEDKQGIAEFIIDNMENEVTYILGPGTTVKKIQELLGIEYTLLGFDAVKNKKLIGKDLNEKGILTLLNGKVKIILSPIGNQGFIIGRGNLQLTKEVLKRINREDIIVVSTPLKLQGIKYLLVDTGDRSLDMKFSGYYKVIVGYGRMKIVEVKAI